MRKVLLFFMTAILLVVLIFMVIDGYKAEKVEILSYKQIGEKSKELEIYANAFDNRNKNDIKQKEAELLKQIENYNLIKSEYEQLMLEKKAANTNIANILDIDFLLVKVGNYATDNSLDLKFDITKNMTDGEASEYILTDLNFEVTGEYIAVADYVSSLENDSRLDFEIRDFKILSQEITDKQTQAKKEVVKATFKVYSVGISKDTLGTLVVPEDKTNTTNTTTNKVN